MIDPKHFTGTLSYCEQCLKVGQTEKDEFYVVSHNMDTRYYVESKKWYKWNYSQNRKRLANMEKKLIVTKGERGGEALGIWN